MSIRVIPRLDIKGPNLVKGIHLEGLRILGRPELFAEAYAERGADELLFMDAVASLYQRNSLLPVIESTSRKTFIPLTVGGGIRSLEQISDVLRAGADKVAINTAAIARPEFVSEASRKFGASTIVVSVDALRTGDSWVAYTDNGRESSGLDAVEWAVRAAECGAGELLVTSIDREGTGSGFDLELVRRIATAVSIPVVACGGAASADDVVRAVTEGAADAVSVASILHYAFVRELEERSEGFEGHGGFEVLRERREFDRITPCSIADLKRGLAEARVPCRPVAA